MRLAGFVDYRRPPWRTDRTCSSWEEAPRGPSSRTTGRGRSASPSWIRPGLRPRRAGGWPEELLDARRPPELHDWGYAGPGADSHRLAFDRARVIGGCSSHNGCAQSWGWRGDYDRWGSTGSAPAGRRTRYCRRFIARRSGCAFAATSRRRSTISGGVHRCRGVGQGLAHRRPRRPRRRRPASRWSR